MMIVHRAMLVVVLLNLAALAGCTHGRSGARTTPDAWLASLPVLPDTPLGRYETSVQRAIGERWYQQVAVHQDLFERETRIRLHFYVTRTGQIRRLRVSKGDPGSALAALSMKAVFAANIPPMPTGLANKLSHGELEVDLGFDYLTR